jgi:hypothetical protein
VSPGDDGGPSLESVPATARRHGFSANSLYRWIHLGQIPDRLVVRLGDRIRIRRRSFSEWVEFGDVPTESAPAQLRAVG